MLIRTAKLPATDTEPARIRVSCATTREVLITDYNTASSTPHKDAAEKLANGPVEEFYATLAGYMFAVVGDSD